jgi:hypothetical protein
MAIYDDYLYGTPVTRPVMPYDPNRQTGVPPPGYNPIVSGPMPGLNNSPVTLPWQPQPVPGSAPPLGAAPVNHPAYGRYYDAPGKNLYNTPFVRDKVSPLLPQGEYQMFLQGQRMANPQSRAGQWGQSQFGRINQLFQAAQLQNPGLNFRKFLKTGGAGNLMNEFLSLSPSARGASQQGRTSVIGWG